MTTRIQFRRGLLADWTSANPVLADGEIGVISDTSGMKIGDGVTAFNDLDVVYLSAEDPRLSDTRDPNVHGAEAHSAAHIDALTDHSLQSNLNSDDHTQYILADGTRALGGSIAEDVSVNVAAGLTPLIDWSAAPIHDITLNGGPAVLSFVNVPTPGGAILLKVRQDGVGGHTITWPAGFNWPGATPPDLTLDANAIDIFTVITTDGGTTYDAFPSGQGMG